jgi:hypothetical protein
VKGLFIAGEIPENLRARTDIQIKHNGGNMTNVTKTLLEAAIDIGTSIAPSLLGSLGTSHEAMMALLEKVQELLEEEQLATENPLTTDLVKTELVIEGANSGSEVVFDKYARRQELLSEIAECLSPCSAPTRIKPLHKEINEILERQDLKPVEEDFLKTWLANMGYVQRENKHDAWYVRLDWDA